MADTNTNADLALEQVILEMRAQRDRARIAAREEADRERRLAEQNRIQAETANIQNEINNSNAQAELDLSRTRNEENSDDFKRRLADSKREKIEAESELARAKAKKILDQNDLEIEKFKAKNNKDELRNMENFAMDMDKVRESLKGSVTNIFDSINNAIKFDIRRKPITGSVALLGIGANSLATQDKIPPIYGMLTKLAGTIATVTSFYAGKGFERLFKSSQQTKLEELIELNPVLKEVAATNKKLALEMAKLKLDRFNQSVKERFEIEREDLLTRQNSFFQRNTTTNEERLSIVNDNNTNNILAAISQDSKLSVERLDSVIELIKNINNQFDSEKDSERYIEEVNYRKELLNILNDIRNREITGKNRNTEGDKFSILEVLGIANIGSTVLGFLGSVSKFLLPLKALGMSLLRFTPVLAGVSALLLTIDLEKDLFSPINNIKKLFESGNYVEGIIKGLLLPVDILNKFVFRSISFLSDLFGFEDMKNKFIELADTSSIYNSLIILKDSIFNMFQSIVREMMLFSENFSLSGMINDSIKTLNDYFNNFKLVDSIKEIFDFIHDKFESLKFWKKDKDYRLSENKSEKNIIPEANNKNQLLNSEKVTKELIASNNSTTNRFEAISKNNSEKLITQQQNLKQITQKIETQRIEKISEKNNVIAPITNTQFNTNNQTSIASRPKARIEENTAMRQEWANRNADYSGYIIG